MFTRRLTVGLLALLTVFALALSACAGPAEQPVDEPDQDMPLPDEGEPAAGSDSREVTLAISDAAEATGVGEDEVDFVSFELVTWPDGALGCPEEGMGYTQALVDGYRILVEAAGEQRTYHGALGDDPFYCADPQEPIPGDG